MNTFTLQELQKNSEEDKKNILEYTQEEIDDLIRIYTDHEEGC